MEGKAVLKVEGGKLVKATVNFEGKQISNVKLSGDFFMYPEDALEKLEARLVDLDVGMLSDVVSNGLEGVELFGVDSESIINVILEAMK